MTTGFASWRLQVRPTRWPRSRVVGAIATVAALIQIAVAPQSAAYPRPGRTERVSVASDGSEANADAGSPSVSADGRSVAFHSSASNLVPDDTNQRIDVFVHDVTSGITERVSVASDGNEANAGSLNASISGDGRYVAFQSAASNLVPGDGNGTWDIFVRDRVARTTERVSVTSDGAEGNGASHASSISGDGRYVAFYSDASNLVPGDTNGAPDAFVHDRTTGTTERVSVASDGSQGTGHPGTLFSGTADGGSYFPSISTDGRHVCFWSSAGNLVAGDTNQNSDVFVHDRETGQTERVSVVSDGSEGNGHSYNCSTSTGGDHVAFESWASNLVPEDTNDAPDIFIHDRATGITERISVGFDGSEGNDYSFNPSVSSDGRFVAFYSLSSTLVAGKTRQNPDVFVRDRETRVTERVSVGPSGTEADGNSSSPYMSPAGRFVAFESTASNLVPGIGNGVRNAFVFDRGHSVGVGDLVVVDEGGRISASGWARLSGAVVASATGSAGDVVPGAADAGADLTAASITVRPEEEDLLVGLELASLAGEAVQHCVRLPTFPPVAVCDARSTGAGAPAVVYGLRFDIDGSSYEIRALRAGTTAVPPETGQYFGLYECAPVCIERARLSGGIGTTGPEVLVSVPLDVLGANEGMEFTGIQAFTAAGEAATGTLLILDEADLPDATIAPAQVSLGIAAAGTPEDEVLFDTPASLAEGLFSGSLDVSSRSPGNYDVWARACLGGVCGAGSAPVTLGEAVEKIATTLELTVEGRGREMTLRARLEELDSPQTGIAGRTIDFFSASEPIGSGETDEDGVTTVPVPPGHRGANRTYEAAFSGDDVYLGSLDKRPGRGGGEGE